MKEKRKIKIAVIALLIIAMLLSVLVLGKTFSSVDTYDKTLGILEEQETTVLKLAAASMTVSTVLTAIPDDVGTPIADQLADLSFDFAIVLCAIYLEKYLLTITGLASFYALIPLACILFGIYVFNKDKRMLRLGKKILAFALIIVLIVPASAWISTFIDKTYENSISETINNAESFSNKLESTEGDGNSQNAGDDGQKSGWLQSIEQFGQDLKETFNIKEKLEDAKQILGNLLESFAIMIVTTCVMPILVLLLFIWLIKVFLAVDIDSSKIKPRHLKPKRPQLEKPN